MDELTCRVKMFLFCRWMAICYADEHMDRDKNSQHNPKFKSNRALSVLNLEDGIWYAKQLKYFEETVYPNYIENGSVANTEKFLSENYL